MQLLDLLTARVQPLAIVLNPLARHTARSCDKDVLGYQGSCLHTHFQLPNHMPEAAARTPTRAVET